MEASALQTDGSLVIVYTEEVVVGGEGGRTYEVCVSFEPDHMMTSAGEVFVRRFFLYTSSPWVTFLNKLLAVLNMPPMSFRA
jgi:hypothetical protein